MTYILALLLCLVFVPSCAHQNLNQNNIRQIPVREFFKNPVSAQFELSPNGKMIAFLQPYQNRMNVSVLPVEAIGQDLSRAQRITSELDRDIMGFFWKGDEHIVFVRDNGGDENFHIYSVNIKTGKLNDLTPYPGVRAEIIDDLEDISKSDILIALNKRNSEVFDVYRLNIKSKKIKLEAQNPGQLISWVTDHKGQVRGGVSSDGLMTSLYYRENAKQPFKKTFTTDFKTSVTPLFFTFDNKYVYASSNLHRDKSAIVKFDLAQGKELEKIFENDEVDVEDLSYSKKRQVLLVSKYTTWKTERHFYDKSIEGIFNKISKALSGYEVSLSSTNRDENKFIIRTYSDKSRGAYYLYEVEKDNLKKISDISPWINESEMAEMRPITYNARDGLTIHGYLTLPLNYVKGQKLPVVVNPHGGPWHRDVWRYNPEVQWLANRGYAVLQMNFRGSTGYGRGFWAASFKQWGKKMQDDITDGVQWLISEKIADPNKVCIYGGSYGGYAVLAGLAFTPDLYACGVDYVGVSNLFTFMKSMPPYWKPMLQMTYEQVGEPGKDDELLRAASPVFHVDRIKAPLFVAQGAKDPRVNINESNQIVEALRAKGVDVPYLVKENEGHGFHNEENRFEFYEKMEEFLTRHLH